MKSDPKIRVALLLILCLLSLVACRSSPAGTVAQVQRVVSGQTIDVLIPSQAATIARVRLLGIAAPDLQQQPWGMAAKELLETLLQEQQGSQFVLQSVVLQSEGAEKDRFGRRLAYVWRDDTLVNEALVARGYALADVRLPSPYSQRLIRAQETARIMGYGIWNPEDPMRITPQEFRSSNNHGSN